jgi:hypothetical protein
MVTSGLPSTSDLFFEKMVAGVVDDPDFVNRQWLNERVVNTLDNLTCRYLLLTGEPGLGKTGVAASLARQHPDWLRYFIRSNSQTAVRGEDIRSFLFSIGQQLAVKRPQLFQPDKLEVVVSQRLDEVRSTGKVVGISIEDLQVSPFFQTALRVRQDAGVVSGELIGIDIKEARVERRLLETDNLQYLALLDPAQVLLSADPDARIVVIIDGLDELGDNSSLLYWLATGIQLPANIRFVLMSRPHKRLNLFISNRAQSLIQLRIDPSQPEVRKDLTSYTRKVASEAAMPSILALGPITTDGFVRQLVDKADGNFQYLITYCRALREAALREDLDTCRKLLKLAEIPADLYSLYSFFLNLLSTDIAELPPMDVQTPLTVAEQTVPAWEGVGQPVLGVLAVARESLTLDQIARFGNIHVWHRHLINVMDRLKQFLDQEGGNRYRLFHSSFAEYITAPTLRDQHLSYAIDPNEWHTRILRSYLQHAQTWAEVDWQDVDPYGLLYIVEHMVALGPPTSTEVGELVNPGARRAMLTMFQTDSQFQRIVELAIEQTLEQTDLPSALPLLLGLTTVRTFIRNEVHHVTPIVLGLLAHLGKIDIALQYLRLMAPTLQRFYGLSQVRRYASREDLERVGTAADLERLIQFALDISPSTDMATMPHRGIALSAAAHELAPVDRARALQLLELAGGFWKENAHDVVLSMAAEAVSGARASEIIGQMKTNRIAAYLDAAQRAAKAGNEQECKDLLIAVSTEIEQDPSQASLEVIVRLAAAWTPIDPARALDYQQTLYDMIIPQVASIVQAMVDDKDVRKKNNNRQSGFTLTDLLIAAEALSTVRPVEAKALLARASQVSIDASTVSTFVDVARLWARLGEIAECRRLVDALCTYARGLEWFEPAREITSFASVLVPFDLPAARALVDEACAMIEPQLAVISPLLDSALSSMVTSLIDWDVNFALKAARWIKNPYWPGSPPDRADDRAAALALIALSLDNTQIERSEELLQECLNISADHPSYPHEGWKRRGVFTMKQARTTNQESDSASAAVTKQSDALLATTYLPEVFKNLKKRRQWRLADTPADTVRWILPPPYANGAPQSWARTFRVLAEAVMERDPTFAENMLNAIIDQSEKAIGLGSLYRWFVEREDARANRASTLVLSALNTLPQYESDINPQLVNALAMINPNIMNPELMEQLPYLSPDIYARFEVALRIAPFDYSMLVTLFTQLDSRYLVEAVRADAFYHISLITKNKTYAAQPLINGLIQKHKQALDSLEQWRDPIHVSYILSGIAFDVSVYNPEASEQIARQISIPVYRTFAQLQLAMLVYGNDSYAVTAHVRAAIAGLPTSTPPYQAAVVRARAASFLSRLDANTSQQIADEGLALARQIEPMFLRGMALLEFCSIEVEKSKLVNLTTEIAELADGLSDQSEAAELLTRLFPVLVGISVPHALGVISRIQGWKNTMSLIEFAAPILIERCGIDIGIAIHSALCRAFTCLYDTIGVGSKNQIDGVDLNTL